MAGRQSLLTPERTKKVCDLIVAGNDQETAAVAAGIPKSSHFAWLARGREERDRLAADQKAKPRKSEAAYLEYLEAIEKARAEREARLVLLIAKAAQEPKTWTAAAWLLERSERTKWGRVTRTEITGADGAPVQIEEQREDPKAALAALLEEIRGKESS
jgi:transposase